MLTTVTPTRILPLLPLLWCLMARGADITSKDFKADKLFDSARVWTARFSFASDQWNGIGPVSKPTAPDKDKVSRFQAPPGLRNGLVGAAGYHVDYVRGTLAIEDKRFGDIGVRYKGNGTLRRGLMANKVSFKADLNRFVPGQMLAGLTKLNFNNNVSDASMMNEALSYRLYRDAGVPASRTSYARVYVTVAGQKETYKGLYTLVEEVDANFAAQRFGSREGIFFKPVVPSPFLYLGEDWKRYNQVYDPKRTPTEAEQRRVIDFSRLVSRGSDAEFRAHVAEFIDLEAFAKFMSVTVWLSSYDGILDAGQNYYVYLDPKTRKFSFVPWDLDHSFGQFGIFRGDARKVDILRPWLDDSRFLERMFSLDAFRKLYLADMARFSKTIFLPERFAQQVDEISVAVRQAVADESEVLSARFDAASQGKTMPDTLDRNFGLPHIPIKPFTTGRAQSVNEQLARLGLR